jgi:hypothetical protein
MDYKKLSMVLYAAAFAVILIGAVIAIANGWSRSEGSWIIISACVLALIARGVNHLARNQERDRVAKELGHDS